MAQHRRDFLKITAMATAAAFSFGALAIAEPVIGQPAPAFTNAVDADGNAHDLADFKGKTVVLEWTNHQCPYVVKHYATNNMQTLQADATQDGVLWLQVISSAPGKQGHVSAEKAKSLNAERGSAPTATIIDESGEVGRLYEAATTPHMFVINPEGVLVYKGAIDDNSSADHSAIDGAFNYVAAALSTVAAGGTPEASDTVPYGCSVKYAS
jgi:peroxiredoxin